MFHLHGFMKALFVVCCSSVCLSFLAGCGTTRDSPPGGIDDGVGDRAGEYRWEPEPDIQPDIEPLQWPRGLRAACSITFDDGTLDQYLLAYPAMYRRNIRGTFFVITGFVGDTWPDGAVSRRTFGWSPARIMAATGQEIGSHGHTHLDLRANPDSAEAEFSLSLGSLQAEVRRQSGYPFSWNYWRSTPELASLASNYFLSARGGTPRSDIYLSSCSAYEENIDIFNVNAFAPLGDRGISDTVTLFRQQYASGGWLVLDFHGIDDGIISRDALGWQPLPAVEFETLLDSLLEYGYWIAPFGTVSKYVRERQSLYPLILDLEGDSLTFRLYDGLDDAIYDLPLTFEIDLPAGWEQVHVSQAGVKRWSSRLSEGRLLFEAVPDGREILIRRIVYTITPFFE